MNRTPPTTVLVLLASAAALATAGAADSPRAPAVEALRSWSDVRLADDGRLQPVRIELAFDYDRGTAVERVLSPEGELIDERPTGRIPSASDAEIARATEILRDDHDFARLILERDVILDGGFVLTEPDGSARCAVGTRCLQIFGFARHDAHRALFCAVVDLVDREIAYRDYWSIGGDDAQEVE